MKIPWKLVGLAGLAGVAATGAVVARNRREHSEYDPEELREKLRSRLAETEARGDYAYSSSMTSATIAVTLSRVRFSSASSISRATLS